MSSSEPNVLNVFAVEDIKMKDVPPGGGDPVAERREKIDSAQAEINRLAGRYVPPHKNVSRWVLNTDIPKVISDGKDMVMMCDIPKGLAHSAKAIAHPQISTHDSLRFFVFPNGKVIINPVILNHTKTPIDREEGCMSLANQKSKIVKRFNKVDVKYQTLGVKNGETEPSLTDPITETLNGEQAHIYQHECGHLNGGTVYDDDYSPELCVGLPGHSEITDDLWNPTK